VNAELIHHTIHFDIRTLVDDWKSGGKYWFGDSVPQSVPPFTASAGDTLETSVYFLPGQSITLNNGATTWGYGNESLTIYWEAEGSTTNPYSTSTSAVTLFTESGNITLRGTSTTGGMVQKIYGNITDTTITFTGFSMTTQIHSAPEGIIYEQFKFGSVISGRTDLNPSGEAGIYH